MSTQLQNTTVPIQDLLDLVEMAMRSITRLIPRHVDREDLASAGKLALVQVLTGFRGDAGEARRVAYPRVRGAILDELRRMDPLSRHDRRLAKKLQKLTAQMEQEMGRVPTDAELADAADIPAAEVRDVLAHVRGIMHAAASLPDDIVDPDAGEIVDRIEARDVAALLEMGLARLPARHADVLRRYYMREQTLAEIGDELRLSTERVRQIRVQAEAQLKLEFAGLALWQSKFASGESGQAAGRLRSRSNRL